MTPRCLYTLLLILTACNSKTDEKNATLFGQRTSYKTSDLAIVSARAIKRLNNEFHGVLFMSNTGKPVSRDTVSSLLYKISKRDITNKDTYETYLRTCNNVDFLTWKSTSHKNVITRIQKIHFKAIIPISAGDKNIITITDFDIYSINKPNHVALRVINDYDLEYLKIDEVEYTRIAESIPVGLHLAIAKVDSAKKKCLQVTKVLPIVVLDVEQSAGSCLLALASADVTLLVFRFFIFDFGIFIHYQRPAN